MTSRQSAGEADKLVRRYLAQLDAALRGVDASRRQDLLAEVRGHIEEERTGLDADDEVSVRTLLGKVGDPAAIAAEAGAPPPGSRRWDVWAPWLIIFGPVASGLGWIAGMLILWTSPTWSRRDQLIATFVPLAGLVALFFGLVAALRGSFLSGARFRPARGGWLHDQRAHPPARSCHTAGRSRSRRSPAAADPPDEDASPATLHLCLINPLSYQPDCPHLETQGPHPMHAVPCRIRRVLKGTPGQRRRADHALVNVDSRSTPSTHQATQSGWITLVRETLAARRPERVSAGRNHSDRAPSVSGVGRLRTVLMAANAQIT